MGEPRRKVEVRESLKNLVPAIAFAATLGFLMAWSDAVAQGSAFLAFDEGGRFLLSISYSAGIACMGLVACALGKRWLALWRKKAFLRSLWVLVVAPSALLCGCQALAVPHPVLIVLEFLLGTAFSATTIIVCLIAAKTISISRLSVAVVAALAIKTLSPVVCPDAEASFWLSLACGIGASATFFALRRTALRTAMRALSPADNFEPKTPSLLFAQVAAVSFLPMTMRTLGDFAIWGAESLSGSQITLQIPPVLGPLIIVVGSALLGYFCLAKPLAKRGSVPYFYSTIILTAGVVSMAAATQFPVPDLAFVGFESFAAMTLVYSRLIFWVVVVRAAKIDLARKGAILGVALCGYGLSATLWSIFVFFFNSSAGLTLGLFAAYVLITAIMMVCERAGDRQLSFFASPSVHNDDLADGFELKCEALAASYALSPRETEVFLLLARGNTRKSIQEKLFLSDGTVKTHTQRIYAKLGVHSRKELFDLVFEEQA